MEDNLSKQSNAEYINEDRILIAKRRKIAAVIFSIIAVFYLGYQTHSFFTPKPDLFVENDGIYRDYAGYYNRVDKPTEYICLFGNGKLSAGDSSDKTYASGTFDIEGNQIRLTASVKDRKPVTDYGIISNNTIIDNGTKYVRNLKK